MEFVEPIREKEKINRIKNLLKHHKFRDYILFVLGINSGLRISDILKLKVKDLLNKNYIEIREQKTKKNKRVLISKYYKNEIIDYLKDKNPESWLFQSQKGNYPISRVQAYRIITQVCISAGIKYKVGTHTLRKTFAYHFYKENNDIALLQKILNHSSPSITLRYIGINQDIIDSKLKMFHL